MNEEQRKLEPGPETNARASDRPALAGAPIAYVEGLEPEVWTAPKPFTKRWEALVLDLVDPQRSATSADVAWFFYRCQRLGLDPLAEQAHFLWIHGRPRFYVGIHGARTLAEKTGERGSEHPAVVERAEDGSLLAITVTVERVRWRGNETQTSTYVGRAPMEEYRPKREFKPGDRWHDAPEGMLEKCAAMLAYRKAFPEVLGDVYVREELEATEERP